MYTITSTGASRYYIFSGFYCMKTLSYTSLNPQIMALRYSVRSVKLVLSVLEREKKK